jgi:DNA polymerase-3 subunit epsilon
MRPSLKYWIFILGISGITFGVILACVAGSWLSLTADEQALVAGLASRIIPFPLMGAFVLVAVIGGLVSLLFRYYIIPILQMAESTQLISLANPDHRIEPKGAREVVHLAHVINTSADAYQKLQSEVDAAIRSAQADLKEERNRFAALMSELPAGVLVCNTDGQILLYNQQTQALLKPLDGVKSTETGQGGWIGLGRSVFGVLQREPIVHGLKLLQQAVATGQAAPTTRFMTTLAGGRCLRVTMAPVFSFRCDVHEDCLQCERRQMSGLVLTLEDMTPRMEADSRRDLLIHSLTDELQEALAEIRRSTASLLSEPELKPERLKDYRTIIDVVSSSLQQQVAQAREQYARHLQALSKEEDVLAENLLEVLRRNIGERLAVVVECKGESGLWLKLDSYAVVQAVTHLAGLLKSHASLAELHIRLGRSGEDTAALDIAWPATPVSSGLIDGWQESPLTADSQGSIISIGGFIDGSGGAIVADCAADGLCRGVRIEFSTMPALVRTDLAPPQGPRPVYYEFDLFNQKGLQELGKQPLRKLTYVVFDTETTGLNPAQGDEIIQIGAVRVVNGRILQDEAIDQLIDPKRPVPEESAAIHGITSEMVAGQPTIEQVMPLFHRFVEGAVMVAHNAAFDMRCLQLKEQQTGVRFDNPVLDTLLLSSVIHPHQETHSLDGIAKRLNLTIVGRHTALGDALVTAEVLLKLIPLLESRGIVTLEDALDASINSPFAKLNY